MFQLQRPFFSRLLRVAGLAGALAVLGAARPALADGPVGLIAGGAFPQGGATFGQPVGQTQWNLGASYDVGPKFGPFRGSLSFDYANGPTDGQSLNDCGNEDLDEAALAAARASTYSPAGANCRSSYTFQAGFTAQ